MDEEKRTQAKKGENPGYKRWILKRGRGEEGKHEHFKGSRGA